MQIDLVPQYRVENCVMRTSELARRAGVNVQTSNSTNAKQLFREPPRTPSGYRSYNERDLEHVASLRNANIWVSH